jgi:hypothetical protein
MSCGRFGGWHLLETYGQYVETSQANTGEEILVRGQFVRLGGPRRLPLTLEVAGEPQPVRYFKCGLGVCDDAERSWGCLYPVDTFLAPIDQAGKYPLVIRDTTSAVVLRGTVLVD